MFPFALETDIILGFWNSYPLHLYLVCVGLSSVTFNFLLVHQIENQGKDSVFLGQRIDFYCVKLVISDPPNFSIVIILIICFLLGSERVV